MAAAYVGKVMPHDDQSVSWRSSNPDRLRDLMKK
jgi:hypothetical protein